MKNEVSPTMFWGIIAVLAVIVIFLGYKFACAEERKKKARRLN